MILIIIFLMQGTEKDVFSSEGGRTSESCIIISPRIRPSPHERVRLCLTRSYQIDKLKAVLGRMVPYVCEAKYIELQQK